MTKKRMRAASTLLGCVLALASSACSNNDKGGGPTDSGLPDASDAALPDAGPDAGDGATPDAGDASTPQVASLRLAHLAFGYGTPVAATGTSPATTTIHVCLKQSLQSDPTNAAQGPRILITERTTGTTHTPSPLPYGAITLPVSKPVSVINSGPVLKSTAEVYDAADIDVNQVGMGATANCVLVAGATPIATFVVPKTGDPGALEAGKAYTAIVSGRNDGVAPGCLGSADPTDVVACPVAAVQVLEDTFTAPTTGTAVRIVNTSTTYPAMGSCTATVADPSNLSTGQSVPVLPLTGTTPAQYLRVTAAPSTAFHSDFVPTSNITPGVLGTTPVPRLFGPGSAAGCPTKLFAPPPTGTGTPDPTMGESYANGSIPQNAQITANYTGVAPAAEAVGAAGTTDGSLTTIFIIDSLQGANVVPVQVLIKY